MNPHTAIGLLLHDLPTAATATFLALFPIVNPIGGVPLFFSLTGDYSAGERRNTALKVALDDDQGQILKYNVRLQQRMGNRVRVRMP